ncbi:MAG TPA: plastocyanin/azurin family copper-binding protein [Solirubrobacteraceae bacterium]|nr:plastocyanin/azurin family copper-binding protein [Solirubrobacteraceae bacterium]
MRRGIAMLAACGAIAVAIPLAGCGSSSSSSTTEGTPSEANASAGEGGTPTGTNRSSLKLATKPKYGKPASGAPVQSGVVDVAYRSITIQPDTLRVKVGTTIRWTNYDPVEHNVTSQGGPQRFASKDFGEGGTYEVKASKPGVIHYECTIHPASMNGTIEVVR